MPTHGKSVFPMHVTREFLETGRTQNQRTRSAEQTSPQTTNRADPFVQGLLGSNPGIEGLAQAANQASGLSTPQAPAAILPEDLSVDEVLKIASMLRTQPHDMDSGAASRIDALVRTLSGQS